MKRYLFLFLFLLGLTKIFSTELLISDFESSQAPGSITSWVNYSNGGLNSSTWSFPNPSADSINSTSKVYKIDKASADPYWTGLEITLGSAISITTANQYLHVLVYKSTSSRIGLTYTIASGTQSSDNWQSNSTINGWVDYVLTIPTGSSLKKVAIKIADDPGTYYFDQILLSSDGTPKSRMSVSVQNTSTNQIFEGWGGSLCWWANIMGGFSDSKIKVICDWITDPINGLNMNIFRFNIGGGDDPTHNHMRSDGGAMPGYKASATSNYDWTKDANQRKILQQLIASRIAKAGVNDVQVIGFSNSPPYWMTVSGCSAGSTDGTSTNLKSDMIDAFADYLTDVVAYYHDSLGIAFNYIEPFNEPDSNWWKANGNQEGCYFSTADQQNVIRGLYNKLVSKNMLTYCKMTANDGNSIDGFYNTITAYKSAGDILSKLDLMSVHSYSGSSRAGVKLWSQTNNKKLWQTETGPLSVGGTNEQQIMIVANRTITDIKNLGCTAWCDWQLGGTGSPLNNPWALIVSDYTDPTNALTQCINFNIRAQFSRYIKAGYRIINNNNDNALTALSPDEKELVIVLCNQNSYSMKYAFDLSGFSGFGKVKQVRTRVNSSYGIKNSGTSFSMNSNSFSYDISPETVTTFIIPINQSLQSLNQIKTNQKLFYSNGKLHFDFSTNNDKGTVYVYDMMGRMVKSYPDITIGSEQKILLNNGSYLVSVIYNSQKYNGKILVMN